jgi:3-methylcrotonyl-CoA carboxylase alpha subunit
VAVNTIIAQIVGLGTNIRFLDDLAGHPEFQLGHVHTGFIEQYRSELFPKRALSSDLLCQGAIALVLLDAQASASRFNSPYGSCERFRFCVSELYLSTSVV